MEGEEPRVRASSIVVGLLFIFGGVGLAGVGAGAFARPALTPLTAAGLMAVGFSFNLAVMVWGWLMWKDLTPQPVDDAATWVLGLVCLLGGGLIILIAEAIGRDPGSGVWYVVALAGVGAFLLAFTVMWCFLSTGALSREGGV